MHIAESLLEPLLQVFVLGKFRVSLIKASFDFCQLFFVLLPGLVFCPCSLHIMRWKVASPSVDAPDSAGNKRWVIFFLTALELKIRPPKLCAFLQVESIQSHCIFKSLTNQDWVLIQSKLPLNAHLVHFPVLIVVESPIEQ